MNIVIVSIVMCCIVCLAAAMLGALIGSDDEAGTLAGFLGWFFGVAVAAAAYPFGLEYAWDIIPGTIVAIALGAVVSFGVAINMAR